MSHKPPIKCTPCRVKYLDTYYRISEDGEVRETWSTGEFFRSPDGKRKPVWQVADEPESENDAKLIRHEAARLRPAATGMPASATKLCGI